MFREITNEDRAEFGIIAIEAFEDACRTDREDALCDLLCDLMHADIRHNLGGFDAQLARARMHFQAEVFEEEITELLEDGEEVTYEL